MVQVCLGKKQDPTSKITIAKRAEDMIPAVESLPTKCDTLSSNPSITKKKRKKERKRNHSIA
jgi:hypothetical protein